MTRDAAAKFLRTELDKHGLKDWSIRINPVLNDRFNYLGMCLHNDRVIVLNAHHIDIHSEPDVINTIRHEIAHAIVGPNHAHDIEWQDKAKEIGCDNIQPCSHLQLSDDVIDAIRSGATVEVSYETETIRRPKYEITRLQDKCPFCQKIAITIDERTVENDDPIKPNLKFIRLDCGHTIIKKIPKGTPFILFQTNGDKDCKHEWNKAKCSLCGRMRPYEFQIDGMRFAEQALAINKGAAIFDEMGLGKTIQALGVIKFHPETWPVLYIVKSGIKFQWFKAILDWCGNEFVGQMITKSDDFVIPGLKTYIISYDLLIPKTRTNKKSGKTINQGFDITKLDFIKTVVLDECQQIKNPDATRTQQVRRLVKDKSVIALSGTPWKNRGSEFFSVLNMLAPTKFHSYQHYVNTWVEKYWHGNIQKMGGINNPKRFKEYTKDIVIRRERTEVMSELPLVNRTKLNIQMTPDEASVYDDAVTDFVNWYNEQTASISSIHILAKMSRLRHLTGLAKIPATMDYIEEFIEDTDRKLVVFVHHIDVGNMLYDECKTRFADVNILKLTGGMSSEERHKTQTQFNENKRAILIASTLAAGEGLNLQTCSDCVIHERQWNPANETQAEGRFIRIGQTASVVNSVYAEAADSIDAQLGQLVEGKRRRFHAAMNNTEMESWNENEIAKDLAEIIVQQHNRKKK